MTYDEFKKAWGLSLRESGLPIMGVEPIEETIDLRTMDRTCESFVEPFGGQRRRSSGSTSKAATS